jgi:Pyruvate/2-oxoacid:ferredoxin oxidoreductase gamma subunit
VYDSSVILDAPAPPEGVHQFGIPFTGIATELGKPVVKNVVALGALQAATNIFPAETMLTAIRQALKEKAKLIPLNEEAFVRGQAAVRT